jgi:hypothetical protein
MKVISQSSDKVLKALSTLSLRAPEGCVAISVRKERLLHFTRNDIFYRGFG